MKKIIRKLVLAVAAAATLSSSSTFAAPTREEVYRSDRLHTVIYRDGQDPNVYWFLPPIKLYENEGKVVYYRRPSGDKINYYFYIQPFMNDDLINLLSGEVPGLQGRSQLKPVIARQFGIQVKQFNATAMGDKITDFHYINQPQLIKVSLDAKDADEFDFFLANKPGIQADVLFNYEMDRAEKYLTIQLSHKEVYNALNIGATGQYQFSRAQIEKSITSYISNKYITVRSKGDIAIPEIINKVIEECFTPYEKKDEKKKKDDWRDWLMAPSEVKSSTSGAADKQKELLQTLDSGWDGGWGKDDDDDPWGHPSGSSGSSGAPSVPKGAAAVQFTFKRDLINSDKVFYYSHQQFVTAEETASIPVYLSTLPSELKTRVKASPLPRRELIVEYTNEEAKPLRTGIFINPDEQYDINAVFAFSANSAYSSGSAKWYRWAGTWPSPDEELYYRIGRGQWNRVNRHAAIKIEGIHTGELQFYLDRKKLWEKIPADFKNSKLLGVVPAIFTYQKTYPQFNVVVTGRKVEVNP